MRKLLYLIVLVGAAACAGPAPRPNPTPVARAPGAPTARGAVELFLNAVRAQDLQAMSLFWGTASGPARDNIPREELEKREIILQCYFNHDAFAIQDEAPPQAAGAYSAWS